MHSDYALDKKQLKEMRKRANFLEQPCAHYLLDATKIMAVNYFGSGPTKKTSNTIREKSEMSYSLLIGRHYVDYLTGQIKASKAIIKIRTGPTTVKKYLHTIGLAVEPICRFYEIEEETNMNWPYMKDILSA